MLTMLLLVATSVKDIIKDRAFLCMYFCKECRVKPDVIDGSQGEVRTGVHPTIVVAGMCTVSWLILRYTLHNDRPRAEDIEVAAYFYWVVVAITACCFTLFTWTFVVQSRVRTIVTSLLAWQVVIILSVYCGVTIAYGDQRRNAERTPAAIIILLNFVFVVVLDVCRTVSCSYCMGLLGR
jgi:hypothetical protein